VVTLTPGSGVHAVLERLVADGIPLAAISNAAFSGRVLRSELARHGLAAPLRFVLSSADIGLRKPATGIFDAGVARLNVLARDTWFVGDTWNDDVLGARQAGLQPLWFRADHTEATSVPILRDWKAFMDHYAAARCRAREG
jgi:putative hydrolase of the HAD superfamily